MWCFDLGSNIGVYPNTFFTAMVSFWATRRISQSALAKSLRGILHIRSGWHSPLGKQLYYCLSKCKITTFFANIHRPSVILATTSDSELPHTTLFRLQKFINRLAVAMQQSCSDNDNADVNYAILSRRSSRSTISRRSAETTERRIRIFTTSYSHATAVACSCHRGGVFLPPRWRHSVTAVTWTFASIVSEKHLFIMCILFIRRYQIIPDGRLTSALT